MSDTVPGSPEDSFIFSVVENGEEVMTLESFEGRYRVRTSSPEMLLQFMLGEEKFPPFFFSLRNILGPKK